MVLKSYAKINLFLSVNQKLSNGFHNIQSIFCLINLSDKIFIKKIRDKKSDKLLFKGPFSKNIKNSSNTVLELLKILRQKKLISSFYSIKILKRVPVFSGLGGGTSNAATIFKYLIKKKPDKKILNSITKKVGTDFRLFFHKQGYIKDIKTVKGFKKKHQLYFLIVFPKIKSSTKEVYSKVRKLSAKTKLIEKNIKSKKAFIKMITDTKNDLQLIVERKYSIIKKLCSILIEQKGCYLSKMTGSGSACFGLFTDKKSSKSALILLRKKYPKFWFSIAKTI